MQSTQTPQKPRLVLLTPNASFSHLPGNCVSLPLPPRVSFSVCSSLSSVLSVSTPLCVSVSFSLFHCVSLLSLCLSYPLSLCASHSVFVSLILGVSQPLSDQLSYVSLSHLWIKLPTQHLQQDRGPSKVPTEQSKVDTGPGPHVRSIQRCCWSLPSGHVKPVHGARAFWAYIAGSVGAHLLSSSTTWLIAPGGLGDDYMLCQQICEAPCLPPKSQRSHLYSLVLPSSRKDL